MKTEMEVRDIVYQVYREVGGDPAEFTSIRPTYGTWFTALKFKIVRVDGSTTVVWRQHVDDDNHQAIKDALSAFHLAH